MYLLGKAYRENTVNSETKGDKALSDEVRVFILDLLSKKPMSIHEIAEESRKKGVYRNINTTRYHYLKRLD